MQTVRLNHAGAMIELPTETVVQNWIASLKQQTAINVSGNIMGNNASQIAAELQNADGRTHDEYPEVAQ